MLSLYIFDLTNSLVAMKCLSQPLCQHHSGYFWCLNRSPMTHGPQTPASRFIPSFWQQACMIGSFSEPLERTGEGVLWIKANQHAQILDLNTFIFLGNFGNVRGAAKKSLTKIYVTLVRVFVNGCPQEALACSRPSSQLGSIAAEPMIVGKHAQGFESFCISCRKHL